MSELEFVAVALATRSSEVSPALDTRLDPAFIREVARAQDAAGFDAVLVHDTSSSVDASVLAAQVLSATERLRVLVTHRPGVIVPTAVARQLAGLDAFHPGRVGVHLPAVDSDREATRDGDWIDRAGRQRRRAEFASILRAIWTSDRPLDFDGEFYRIAPTWTPVRPANPVTVHASGASAVADDLAARFADSYVLPSDSLAALKARIAAVEANAARYGRDVRVGLRLRPVLAATHVAAEDYASRVLRVHRTSFDSPARALRAVTGEIAGLGSLVGTPDEVAETLRTYQQLGIGTVRLAAWEPRADVDRHAELIAAVRAPDVSPELAGSVGV